MKRTNQFPLGIGEDDAAQLQAEPHAMKPSDVRSLGDQLVAHELTRILPERRVPYVAQPDDAPALLRIVEEQARDLVKLRRALVGANSLAAERRKIIQRELAPAGERPENKRLSERVRHSTKSLRRTLREIGRMLRQGGKPDRVIPPTERKPFGSHAEKGFGYEVSVAYSTQEFLKACRAFGIDAILDVGANTGQFAQSVRHAGYTGHIISFEPLSDAHAHLVSAAANDALWDVVERCAVGAAPGETQINIAGNSYSSSLLPMLDRLALADPGLAYRGAETCRVITLDHYVDSAFSDPTVAFGLKVDTQGYEAQVLEGARRNFSRIKVILCEMSLVPLYEGAPTTPELCRLLADFGYRCVAMAPEFEDPSTGELLQVNGIFVRR